MLIGDDEPSMVSPFSFKQHDSLGVWVLKGLLPWLQLGSKLEHTQKQCVELMSCFPQAVLTAYR